MASKGRDGDSMLVHMTPGEVHGLQALAMKHGGSLTVNPDTGLPEANFLKSLLPMIAGFALGPAGFGLVSSAMGAGAVVGGLTGIATGSLSKGLMAGLGAYGGFGIGESLAGLGAGELAQGQISANMPTLAEGATQTQIADYATQVNDLRTAGLQGANQLPMADKLSAGFSSATASPMDALHFAKDNKMALGMAAAPIAADMMVPTTTKAPSPMAPGRIREKRWNGQYFEDVADTDAAVYNESGRSFSDLYRGYNNGGIVALADGGVPGYALGGPPTTLTDEQLFQKTGSWEAAAAARDQQNRALNIYNDAQRLYTASGAAPATQASAVPGVVDVTQPGQYVTDPATGKAVALSAYSAGFDPNNKIAQTYLGELAAGGGKDTTSQMFNQMGASQGQKDTNAAAYAVELARLQEIDRQNALKTPTGLAQLDTPTKLANNAAAAAPPANETPEARDARLFQQAGGDWNKAAALRTAEDKALVADPNYWTNKAGLAALAPGASDTTKWFAARGLGFDPIDTVIDDFLVKYKPQLAAMLPKEQEAVMRAALEKEKLNEADVIKATGMTIAQLAAAKRADGSLVVAGDLKDIPIGAIPGGVSGGSDTFINENGTVTTRPDTSLPMKDVRNAYTEGGGSLGYTSPSFDKIEDFNAKYVDRMTGDSRAAYDYLTGKAGATYPTKSTVGQIARPYDEAVLGYPARGNLPFTYDKATGKMVRNMDYVAAGRDDKGNVTYGMSLNDVKKLLTDTPLSGQALYDWAQTNKVSAQQIADATGRSLSSVYADFRKGSSAAATKDKTVTTGANTATIGGTNYDLTKQSTRPPEDNNGEWHWDAGEKKWVQYGRAAAGGLQTSYAMGGYAVGGGLGSLGSYSDGGRLLRGPGDGVSDSIPATIGRKQQPARLADGEFVIPARIVSELGNGSTDAGAKKLYAMMDRVQRARGKTTGKNKVAANSRADKYLPA